MLEAGTGTKDEQEAGWLLIRRMGLGWCAHETDDVTWDQAGGLAA